MIIILFNHKSNKALISAKNNNVQQACPNHARKGRVAMRRRDDSPDAAAQWHGVTTWPPSWLSQLSLSQSIKPMAHVPLKQPGLAQFWPISKRFRHRTANLQLQIILIMYFIMYMYFYRSNIVI